MTGMGWVLIMGLMWLVAFVAYGCGWWDGRYGRNRDGTRGSG